jgi:hypothetical protein
MKAIILHSGCATGQVPFDNAYVCIGLVTRLSQEEARLAITNVPGHPP